MAIKPANSNYHTFTFNGVRAADYGIYVTDVNVFNSAARDVEYIQIPGRDGAFALDRGRFQNISVVYKCAMTQDTDEDFATAISEFRNAIASTKGYKRLEDDIHTDEYRMGVFSKGLEAPTLNTKTATFDVEFNCQPQRFLKSGETAVSVASGGTITNPTLFESSPLLVFDATQGDATISLNDETVTFENRDVGNVIVTSQEHGALLTDTFVSYPFEKTSLLNSGDVITMGAFSMYLTLRKPRTSDDYIYNLDSVTTTSSNGLRYVSSTSTTYDNTYRFDTNTPITFPYRGEAEDKTVDIYLTLKFKLAGYPDLTITGVHVSLLFRHNYFNALLKYSYENSNTRMIATDARYTCAETIGYSTKPTLSGTMYFDLDIGEAYRYEGGNPVAINNAASFGSDLPTLKSGVNTITYTGGMTNFKIVPRWWEV